MQAEPQSTTTTLQSGAVFAGRYRIVRCIAQGGMGAVYDVVHMETERRRALKVMLPHVLESDDHRARFKREAKIAAAVDSEFIVDVFDAGIDEATKMPFLVMELLKGEDLAKHLERRGKFSFVDTVTYLHQASLALDKTHKASIVHRDLKPENLFLTEREDGSPRIKVLDFGIAKVVEQDAGAKATRAFMGTPLYMAPEQYRGERGVSSATDVYALGMMAFTFLVGKPYWHDEALQEGNVYSFAMAAMAGPQEPATKRAERYGTSLPHGFNLWFHRATQAEPSQRFQIASAAVIELAEVLGVESPAQRAGLPDSSTLAVGVSPSKIPPALRAALLPKGATTPMPASGGATGDVVIPKSNAGIFVALAFLAIVGGGAAAFFVVKNLHGAAPAATASATSAPAATATIATTSRAPTAAPDVSASASASASASVAPLDSAVATTGSTATTAKKNPPPPAVAKPKPIPLPPPPASKPPAQPTYSRD